MTTHEFASKYLDFLEHTAADDRPMYSLIDNTGFADECRALGFEMDCGQSFIKVCSEEAWNSVDALRRIVDNINDVKLLGSAIFSQWRYFNHWAGCCPEEKDREWFIVIFRRLKEIAAD